MKKITIMLINVLLITNFYSPCKAFQTDSLIGKANILKALYKEIIIKKNHKCEKTFFKEFPNNFKEFVALYDYEDSKPHILYEYYAEHITLFNNLKSINDTGYYNKLIDLSIGGRWNADAIGLLQEGLRGHVLKKGDLTIYLLKKRSEKQIYSFWIFYFDGPHPSKVIDKKLNVISNKYPSMYQIIRRAHKAVINDWQNE